MIEEVVEPGGFEIAPVRAIAGAVSNVVMLYRACNLVLETDTPLADVPRCEDGEPQCWFSISSDSWSAPREGEWVHDFCTPGGTTWISVWRLGAFYMLRFPDLADFVISNQGDEVRAYPAPGVPEITIRHLLLGQVLPFVLSRRGDVVLHASAVVSPVGAIAFLGASGQGKSTLTASLTQRGLPLLADDCLLVQGDERGFAALPGYGGIRLWPDSIAELYHRSPDLAPVAHYTDKLVVRPSNDGLGPMAEPVELRRIYLLDPIADSDSECQVAITPMSQQEGFINYLKHSYRLDPHDRPALATEFSRLTQLAAAHLLFRLTYPRNFLRLRDVEDTVLADCGCHSDSTTSVE